MTHGIRRDDIMAAFRPLKPILDVVLKEARDASAFSVVAAANPEIRRDSHIHRLSGTKRWALVADGLVDRVGEMPEGFRVVSTDDDYNAGKYVFSFRGGVFTVRREPHTDDEGLYLQTRLEEVLEQSSFADGIDGKAGVKVFLSVPAVGRPKLVVTHPTLTEATTILIDDLGAEAPVVIKPSRQARQSIVRSTLKTSTDAENPVEGAK